MTPVVAPRHGNRCGAVPARECRLGAEPPGIGRLADDLGGGERAAALQLEQARRSANFSRRSTETGVKSPRSLRTLDARRGPQASAGFALPWLCLVESGQAAFGERVTSNPSASILAWSRFASTAGS